MASKALAAAPASGDPTDDGSASLECKPRKRKSAGSDDDADTLSADVATDRDVISGGPVTSDKSSELNAGLHFFNGEEVEMLDEHLSPVCASSAKRSRSRSSSISDIPARPRSRTRRLT